MAQIFHPAANSLLRVALVLAAAGVLSAGWLANTVMRSPYVTQVGVVQEQPVPFSHQHHVGEIGIDCRYCHVSVEESSFAGIPPTETCIGCHSILWADSPLLEPVHRSQRSGKPIEWVRVHDLPDFVYFDHSVHVAKGIGCEACHGRVDRMPLVARAESLHMIWCLDCHRHPEGFVRPREEVFEMGASIAADTLRTQELIEAYQIETVTDCSACHR